MPHSRQDDFADIRGILSDIVQSQQRTQIQQTENTLAISELRQAQSENLVAISELRQTQSENLVAISELRQTQSENLVAISELRQGIAELRQGVVETRQICDSNARSLEAMQSRIDGSFDLHERMMQIALEDRQQWREQRQSLIERDGEIANEQDDTRQSIQNLLEDARADRRASEQVHLKFEQSIQNLLEDARADRQAREHDRLANQQELQAFRETIETLLQDARADRQASAQDRQANEQEHKAFREIVRSMLAEMAQIWQRLAS